MEIEKKLIGIHVCIKSYAESCSGETSLLYCLIEKGIMELGKVVFTISEGKGL